MVTACFNFLAGGVFQHSKSCCFNSQRGTGEQPNKAFSKMGMMKMGLKLDYFQSSCFMKKKKEEKMFLKRKVMSKKNENFA